MTRLKNYNEAFTKKFTLGFKEILHTLFYNPYIDKDVIFYTVLESIDILKGIKSTESFLCYGRELFSPGKLSAGSF